MAAWQLVGGDTLALRSLPTLQQRRVLAAAEGLYGVLAVVETPSDLRLYTNGHSMSGTALLAQRYMRAFAHLPLLQQERPEDVLVICFGVGNTAHASSLHPSVKRLEVADLSRQILEHAGWFRSANQDVLADPRVRVFVDDGRRHLLATPPGSYDLVTLEPPPIAQAGVASLYSRDFYQLARSRLKPGGMLNQWLPVYQLPGPTALELVRAFVEVFPASVLLSGVDRELILLGAAGPRIELDLDRVEAQLAARPAVAADLKRVQLGTLTEIAGTFLADGDALREATSAAAPVTDDWPSMEYAVQSEGEDVRLPASLFHPERAARFCPACFARGGPERRVAHLDQYLAFLGRLYRTPEFLEVRAFAGAEAWRQRALFDTAPYADAIADSPYLQAMLSGARRRHHGR
jgi:spermidine synthase